MADPMNRHTQIRQAVLARLREQCGDSATFFDGLPAFIDAQELPAVAVWLSDAQYTGKMTDEDDWQAVLHIAVFIRAQAPDSELDMWMESTIFPALTAFGPFFLPGQGLSRPPPLLFRAVLVTIRHLQRK